MVDAAASVVAESHSAVMELSHSLIGSFAGYLALLVFVVAYVLVILEEKTHLRKSKPVLIAAGLIWLIVAVAVRDTPDAEHVHHAIQQNFLEYAELFFFLLVAMTYVNAMMHRGVFEALRFWLLRKGFTFRQLFWITGWMAFFISPIADNLTTALIMCAVVLAVGKNSQKFVSICCVNIVVAANAGGAFSPFGDITTLMVWTKGVLPISTFLELFVPCIVNFLVPAVIMHFFIPNQIVSLHIDNSDTPLRKGGLPIVVLFIATIATTVSMHMFLDIPPVVGMMLGLGYLKLYGYYLHHWGIAKTDPTRTPGAHNEEGFDIFKRIAQAEWDTLFFFYGVIMAVGGLGFIGYLSLLSEFSYTQLGATYTNVLIGLISALIDNIPVMFAVLSMNPTMGETQWLLATLTAGVGGSLLSIGSAAGVALMGQARGQYTFFSHLKWTPAIALGYGLSIITHLYLSGYYG